MKKYMVVHKADRSLGGNITITAGSPKNGIVTIPYIDTKNNFSFYKGESLINIVYTLNNFIEWNCLDDRTYFDRNLLNEFILDEIEANKFFKHYEAYMSNVHYKDIFFKISINDNYESLTDQEFFDHIKQEIDNYFILKEII